MTPIDRNATHRRERIGWSFAPNYAGYVDLLGSGRFRLPCPRA